MHLDLHLENNQRVYFRKEKRERVQHPRNKTLMALFGLCREVKFAKTLLYEDVPAHKQRGEFQCRH